MQRAHTGSWRDHSVNDRAACWWQITAPAAYGRAIARSTAARLAGQLAASAAPGIANAQAIAAGKRAYDQWCASCHLADATGRMGSNLIDAQVTYPRVKTDAGFFEVVYAGATGAMQSFGNRIAQDDILKIIAYVNSLKKK